MDMKHSRKSGLTGRQKKQIRLVLLLLPFMIMIGIFSYAPLFGWSYHVKDLHNRIFPKYQWESIAAEGLRRKHQKSRKQ